MSERIDRFQVVPAAYVLLRRDGEVLLQRRQNTGYHDEHWATSAAGHVEAGEPRLQEDKASDLCWFRLDDLPQPVVPHELFVLEGVRSGTLPPVVAFGFSSSGERQGSSR